MRNKTTKNTRFKWGIIQQKKYFWNNSEFYSCGPKPKNCRAIKPSLLLFSAMSIHTSSYSHPMQNTKGTGLAPALTPPHTPTLFTGQYRECEKRCRRRDKVIHTEELLLWLERQQSLSCSIVGAQGPPMSSKQKARGTPLLDSHNTHTQDFLLRKHGNGGGGVVGTGTMQLCTCVPLHA